jgi:hypothetical protein
MNTKTLLDQEIETRFDELSKMEAGTKEYAAAAETLAKLVDRRIDIEKLESSEAHTEKQMKEDRKDRIFKNLIGVGGIVLPIMVTIWGTLVSLKFEEEGTITTITGKAFFNKLFSRK